MIFSKQFSVNNNFLETIPDYILLEDTFPNCLINSTINNLDTYVKLCCCFRTPITIGIFAINKAYFLELGGFDSDMTDWGGENIDFSLRVSRNVNENSQRKMIK